MGMAKRLLEDQWTLGAMAERVLCDVGAVKECEFHEQIYFDGNGDLEAAYKLANSRITSGMELSGGMRRRDFTDKIKEVYEELSCAHSCWACDRFMED